MTMAQQRGEMDVAGYERGVVSLPDRLRLYARLHKGVQLTLNREQALLLADDLERGIAARDAKQPDGMPPGPAVQQSCLSEEPQVSQEKP